MALKLVYDAPEKVDTREDWQKVGKYQCCHACVSLDGPADESIFVQFMEWGSRKWQHIGGFKSYSAAILYAKGLNIKPRESNNA